MADRGVSLARPMPSVTGDYLVSALAPEGNRLAMLLTEATGLPADYSDPQ